MTSQHAAAAATGVVQVRRLELVFAPQPWPFAQARRAAIEAHFEERRSARPALWNGPVLLMHRHRFEGELLQGALMQTDYASFMAWRDWGYPEAGVTACFSMGALRGSDGGWLLGVMAQHTAAAGKIYFPAGTPDPGDVSDGMVDLAGSVTREVTEETGLTPADYTAEDGWHCVRDGACLALMKVLRAREPAAALRRRILDNLAAEPMPELADIRIVRHPGDLDPMMPSFVPMFLFHIWTKP
jgi:8-oxo-dGTP pyrophosphatase MutT (NUDIX family)